MLEYLELSALDIHLDASTPRIISQHAAERDSLDPLGRAASGAANWVAFTLAAMNTHLNLGT